MRFKLFLLSRKLYFGGSSILPDRTGRDACPTSRVVLLLCMITIPLAFAFDSLPSETNQAVFVSSASQALLSCTKDGDVKVEIKLRPSNIPDKRSLPFRIVAKPASNADRNLPRGFYIPEGCEAYSIIAQDISGAPIDADKIRGTFRLGLGYPKRIRLEVERGLRLFILSDDKWLPVLSQLDVFQRMVKTESAREFGTYRLLAESGADPKGVIAYPNPINFAVVGVSKTLKFLNVPSGSVIEIFTVTGEQIREVVAEKGKVVAWDGKKEDGKLVTSGLYIYRVQMEDKEAFGKIAVK